MRIQLLIGTRKGGFIATSDGSRRKWSLKGPLLKGSEINHIAHVGNDRLVMAGKSAWWGPAAQISDDAGETWRDPGPIRFAEGRGYSVERIWFIRADPRVPGRLSAGVDPGALFVSDDRGETWREVTPLTDHPTRAKWFHMEMHTQQPEILYQQNHCGVYRSDDSGDKWTDISPGLPSRFGFPFAVLPGDGDTVFVVPEESDQVRVTPNSTFGIFRSRNRGATWERLTEGLPQEHGFVNVMRMAMTVDALDAPGVYVGTQGGQILASRDGGDNWEVLFNWLPPVYALETAVL